jgi:hypothetical protein
MSDSEALKISREAMASKDPELQIAVMQRLQKHRFKSSRVPEREYSTYALGILESRFGDPLKAATTLRELERWWPRSQYLDEAQVVIAAEAIEHKRFKEAETRLRKAIASDAPPEKRRKAQELLLWLFVEQNRPEAGREIVRTLHPLGLEQPTEKGMAAIAICLCAAGDKKDAEQAVKDYQFLFTTGILMPRVRLAWGRMLGSLDSPKESAEEMRSIITNFPKTLEADEARLALATLLTDGKLSSAISKEFPDPSALIKEMENLDPATDIGRRKILVRSRIAVRDGNWSEALDLIATLKRVKLPTSDLETVNQLRSDAFQGLTRQQIEKQAPGALLPYLDSTNISSLSPADRSKLCVILARSGLVEAARTLFELSPAKEKATLRKVILEAATPESSPDVTLALAPSTGAGPIEALRRAQVEASLGNWGSVKALLPKAKPGPERVQVILTYLRRPLSDKETNAARRKEAETLLSGAKEPGKEREALVVLVADLRATTGDWQGALSLYPQNPSPENAGWVALMRASAMIRVGKKEQAKELLKASANEASFKNERRTLARQAGLEL